MQELPAAYNFKEHEADIYKLWEESGFFAPEKLSGKKPFTIVLPPPNITGTLHMGHALNAVIQDILIRKKRMEGYRTLWLPGTDHAGIATQNVVEKELKKEGLRRQDLGREKFLERVWQWKEKYGDIILHQLKKLGSSCDWSRTRFTMDSEYQKAVASAFLHYYEKGWIYQGERVVNWCPRCATSLSDLELEYKEEKIKLYYIKYPVRGRGFITVATTRPETMLGDSAVAVNPKDKRYKDFIGKTAILPIQEREIPIVADKLIDPKFGTGAVKVTPAHDLADAEIGTRHNLPFRKVIDEKGIMTAEAGKICEGFSVKQCRMAVVEKLKTMNLLEKEEDYTHSIALCYRCNSVVEPILSKQWFLKMDKLAPLAKKAVKSGKIKFHPKRWEKIYFDWLNNVKDWCISRQIWWGHKIPIEGVDDVLDTWFSSALWPFAVFNEKEKKIFYPGNVLVTARDIINLWVGRMIFSGIEFMRVPPFRDVIIHATILTKDGKRMSKSLGTGVDPMALIEQYGADATRFALMWQAMKGQDIHWSEEAVIAGRKFVNKIWNAARFVLAQIEKEGALSRGLTRKGLTLTVDDKKILAALEKTKREVEKRMENYEFGYALHILYDFFWHDFCDKYLETSKKQLAGGQKKETTQKVLFYVLTTSLKLLHPFMPFSTEYIWSLIPAKSKKMLIVENWPA